MFAYILLTLFLTYYLTRLLLYMPCYKNVYVFHRYILHAFPEQARARHYLIRYHMDRQAIFHAIAECGNGLVIDPKDYNYNYLLAKCLIGIGKFADAHIYLDKAEKLIPLPHYEMLKKRCDDMRGQFENAEKRLKVKAVAPTTSQPQTSSNSTHT